MSTKNLVATYGMIQNYRNERTNKWLTLAEFIDNSISSWIQTKDREDDVNGLKISIIYDYSDSSNKTMTIIDNANGMDADELVNSLQPSDTKGKSDLKYNQYGVGMKLGIFWNGEDTEIYSKKNGIEYYTELKTSKHNLDEAVSVESIKSFQNVVPYEESGTTIKIEKVYSNRVLKQGDFESIVGALGWRYRQLLANQEEGTPGMEIWLIQKNSDKKAQHKEELVKPFFVKPFTLESFVEKRKKENNFDNIRFQREYLENIDNLMQENSENRLLLEFCQKLKNNRPLESTIDIFWKKLGKYAKLKFGIINPIHQNSYSKVCGVTTFHMHRAINHGPNTKSSENQCINFNINSKSSVNSGGNPTWRRLFGEINLTGFEKPDQNKSRFDWSNDGDDILYSKLFKIWKDLMPLLDLILEWEKLKIVSVMKTLQEKETIAKYSKNSLDNTKFEISVEPCEETDSEEPCFFLKDSGKKIWIIESEDEDFVYVNEKNDEELLVYYNVNHRFWKSFSFEKEKDKIRGESIYPLILLIALCNDSLEKKSKNCLEFFDYEEEPKNFIEIMNIVVKAIESKNED
ncbi:MAG: ATP-binding protein [Malacoplasma sp.]|nr:ATP-binding protein [Malacoplasma sp.]